MGTKAAPVADIGLEELMADPFAVYKELHSLGRVVWFPAIDRYCVTRHDDVIELEKNTEQFSVADLTSPTVRALGESILSKDGDSHRRERASCEPALRPKVVVEDWASVFQRNTDAIIDTFAARGSAELDQDFGSKIASRNIADMLGFRGVSEEAMLRWSRAIVGGCGNYARDGEVFAACDVARREIDEAIAEVADDLRRTPDASIISAMVQAEGDLSIEEMGRNASVIIGGGINEPNHAISTEVLGLLSNPGQLAEVLEDDSEQVWKRAFEETMRWIAPLGITLRKTVHAGEFAGVHLDEGVNLAGLLAGANRDGERYEDADKFIVNRPAKPHLGFGSGSHLCLGMWVARVSVGQIAVPTLFRRLPNLRLTEPVSMVGDAWTNWMFRGLSHLEVTWDVA